MALGGPVFNAILEVAKRGRLHLLTSAFCYLEAWRNVELKVPERRQALEGILKWVRLVPEARPEAWMADLLPEKDVPVLAAVAAQATHLLTGDLRHFAPFRDPSSISPLNGAMTTGHFLLHRPVARRPAQQSRSAARTGTSFSGNRSAIQASGLASGTSLTHFRMPSRAWRFSGAFSSMLRQASK
jgi:hypothetical protein